MSFPIEAGHVLMFARAIGDENPDYVDINRLLDTEGDGVVPPPTFVQSSAQFSPDYVLRPKPGQPWFGSGATPTGTPPADTGKDKGAPRGAGLHAEQHFEFHRPLRVGDVLTSVSRPGATWEKHGRSGRLVFSENISEYRDADGELVITARSVGVMTEGPSNTERSSSKDNS